MSNSKFSVEELKNFIISNHLVSVYDLECYTTQELLYTLAKKINELIKETGRFESGVVESLEDMANELDELLRGGKVEAEI